MSDETGQFEVYVRPYAAPDSGRWKVSANGGRSPLWSRDGRELFYRDFGGALLSVPIAAGHTFMPGPSATIIPPSRKYAGFGSAIGARSLRRVARWQPLPDDQEPGRRCPAVVRRRPELAGGGRGPAAAAVSRAGRPAIDPKTLVALWLHATMDGVRSAREVDRLCSSHDAYRWLRGGVSVNFHTLSDFRVAHQAAFDDLLTQSITALLHRGVVTMARVAHDSTRVRGSAGAGSFRRGVDAAGVCAPGP